MMTKQLEVDNSNNRLSSNKLNLDFQLIGEVWVKVTEIESKNQKMLMLNVILSICEFEQNDIWLKKIKHSIVLEWKQDNVHLYKNTKVVCNRTWKTEAL